MGEEIHQIRVVALVGVGFTEDQALILLKIMKEMSLSGGMF